MKGRNNYLTNALCAGTTLVCGIGIGRLACVKSGSDYFQRQEAIQTIESQQMNSYEIEFRIEENGDIRVYENGVEIKPQNVPNKSSLEVEVEKDNSLAV